MCVASAYSILRGVCWINVEESGTTAMVLYNGKSKYNVQIAPRAGFEDGAVMRCWIAR